MRKENKVQKVADIARISGYHAGGYHNSNPEAYATMGFKKGFQFYRSDRATPIIDGLRKDNNKAPDGYGLEIELECSSIYSESVLAEVMDKIIFPHFRFPEMFKMQEDGSLGGHTSVECITGVMSQSRVRNDYEAWRLFFDTYLPSFRIKADTYQTTCGMHVNISNVCFGSNPDEAVRKLYYIVNKHYDVFRRLFYRAHNKTDWCGQMDYSVARTMNLHTMSSSHHNCLNYSHYDAGRIEIRLVGGQKDFDTFMRTMESVFFIVERVKTLRWEDVDDLTKIFEGCNQYVMGRIENMHLAEEIVSKIREKSVHEDL